MNDWLLKRAERAIQDSRWIRAEVHENRMQARIIRARIAGTLQSARSEHARSRSILKETLERPADVRRT
jgi:hypothetical protein